MKRLSFVKKKFVCLSELFNANLLEAFVCLIVSFMFFLYNISMFCSAIGFFIIFSRLFSKQCWLLVLLPFESPRALLDTCTQVVFETFSCLSRVKSLASGYCSDASSQQEI